MTTMKLIAWKASCCVVAPVVLICPCCPVKLVLHLGAILELIIDLYRWSLTRCTNVHESELLHQDLDLRTR